MARIQTKQKSRYTLPSSLIEGLVIALFASTYLYLAWIGWSHPLPNTILGVLALYLLLNSERMSWFWAGFFIGILWFWWISMSFRLYGFHWATPIGILLTALTYGLLFLLAAFIAEKIEKRFRIPSLWLKALFLLGVSWIHPFGFDWFKIELLFVESYLGVQVWQLALILLALVLTITRRRLWYLIIIILAYQPTVDADKSSFDANSTKIVTTYIPIEEKFDPRMLQNFVQLVEQHIERAIINRKRVIIFPESTLPIFLNKEQTLLAHYMEQSHDISIVIGALHWDDSVPRNSAYIFHKGRLKIADKVVLVPFGESNPLPNWLGNLVNEVFYDGAVDYKASGTLSDYTIDETTYRNAICYEACSEQLYLGSPKHMIVISNNGWFTPSIEPTQQRLLLQYYSRKYGTTIYHSINKSPSYVIENGKVIWMDTATPPLD